MEGAGPRRQVRRHVIIVRRAGRSKRAGQKKKSRFCVLQESARSKLDLKFRRRTPVAVFKTSCDNLLLGDLHSQSVALPARCSPEEPARRVRRSERKGFRQESFMARDGREMLGREQVVYDLGRRRPRTDRRRRFIARSVAICLETTKTNRSARATRFSKRNYRGGKFSIRSARRQRDAARIAAAEEGKRGRPTNLRKIVGEIVLDMQENRNHHYYANGSDFVLAIWSDCE